jgi:hypothetical protein
VEWSKQLKLKLKDCRQYLTTDYKLHVKKVSRVSDHCAQHALSDPSDEQLQNQCTKDSENLQHVHDQLCQRCETCRTVIIDLQDNVKAMMETEANNDAPDL